MIFRDRIRELRRVPARELLPHAKNWRQHPPAQAAALRGLLSEIGYADALVARETAAGNLELIDGHLRAETTPDAIVPVLVVDVTEAEAEKLLLTLDPLAGMAEADTSRVADLLATVGTESEAVRELLERIAASAGCNGPVRGDAPDPETDRAAELGAMENGARSALGGRCASIALRRLRGSVRDFASMGRGCPNTNGLDRPTVWGRLRIEEPISQP